MKILLPCTSVLCLAVVDLSAVLIDDFSTDIAINGTLEIAQSEGPGILGGFRYHFLDANSTTAPAGDSFTVADGQATLALAPGSTRGVAIIYSGEPSDTFPLGSSLVDVDLAPNGEIGFLLEDVSSDGPVSFQFNLFYRDEGEFNGLATNVLYTGQFDTIFVPFSAFNPPESGIESFPVDDIYSVELRISPGAPGLTVSFGNFATVPEARSVTLLGLGLGALALLLRRRG